MMLNLIVLLLIVLITLYLSTQGMLSALIALVTATFSSVLAMALLEPLQGLLAGWKPEFARGVTFLALFMILFAVTRFIGDIAVPQNIKLPPLVNRSAGGVIGFITALVVVGTTVIGLEMMPLRRDLLGYDRFPGENAMQAANDNQPILGEVSNRTSGIWFGPDQVVLALWNGASGRALGGNWQWADIHPNLSVESYGYRNNVVHGSSRIVPQDLFSVRTAWSSVDPKEYEALKIPPSPGRGRVVMVRTEVKLGDKEPHVSIDPNDKFFRITPTQVRLVTDKQRQYYPIGYLDAGRTFIPLPLNSGHIVEDYANNIVVEDWVFQIGDDERPRIVEMKQFGRAALTDVKDKPLPALAQNAYPPKRYRASLLNATVVFDPKGKKLESGKVYLVRRDFEKQDVDSELNTAFAKADEVLKDIEQSSGGWSATPKPGVPPVSFFRNASRQASNVKNNSADTPLDWGVVLPILMVTPAEPDGERNLNTYPAYVQDHLVPMLSAGKKGTNLLGSAEADASGKAVLPNIQPGAYAIIATMKTDRGFYIYLISSDFSKSSPPPFTVSTGDNPPLTLKIDLDDTRTEVRTP